MPFSELPYQDAAGFWRCLWQMANGNTLPLKFQHEPSAAECLVKENEYIALHLWDSEKTMTADLFENTEVIIDAVRKIRQNPNLTLAQYNTYVNAKPWYEAYSIRYFIYKLAVHLARHYGVNLQAMTETQVLQGVRDWICNQPIGRVKRVIFGMLNIVDI